MLHLSFIHHKNRYSSKGKFSHKLKIKNPSPHIGQRLSQSDIMLLSYCILIVYVISLKNELLANVRE